MVARTDDTRGGRLQHGGGLQFHVPGPLRAVLGRWHGQEALVRGLDGAGAAATDRLLARRARGPVREQQEQEHERGERGGQQERVALGSQHEEPVGRAADAAAAAAADLAVHGRAHHGRLVVLGELGPDAGAHLVRPLGRQVGHRCPGRGAVEPVLRDRPAHRVHGHRYRALARVRPHGRQVHGHEHRRPRHQRGGQVPDVRRLRCRRHRRPAVGCRLVRVRHQRDDVAAAQHRGRLVRLVGRVSLVQHHAVPADNTQSVTIHCRDGRNFGSL